MSFSLNTQTKGDVVVLALAGRFTLGPPTAEFRNEIRSQLDSGKKLFVLNMENLAYVDSGGLGELVRAYTSIRSAGGKVNILKLTSRIQGLMQLIKLTTVFEFFDSEAVAVAALLKHDE